MKVHLKADWFVEGVRYRRSRSKLDLRDVPDHLHNKVPSSATIVSRDPFVPVVDETPASLATKAIKKAAHANDKGAIVKFADDAEEKAKQIIAQAEARARALIAQAEATVAEMKAEVSRDAEPDAEEAEEDGEEAEEDGEDEPGTDAEETKAALAAARKAIKQKTPARHARGRK